MAGQPYVTPANERSFSGLVDRVTVETGRINAFLSIIQYVNLVVRECQTFGLFAQDLIEDEITPTADPHIWFRPTNFRSLRSVRYSITGEYPMLRLPGKIQRDQICYFYAADNYFVFKGALVATGEKIQTASYYWRKPLLYYSRLGTNSVGFQGGPYNVRKAYYDIEAEAWKYLNSGNNLYIDTLGDLAEEEIRRNNATNWLIVDWYDVVLEGVKAKIFKQYDDERAAVSYALYKEGQRLLQRTAGFEGEVTTQVGAS